MSHAASSHTPLLNSCASDPPLASFQHPHDHGRHFRSLSLRPRPGAVEVQVGKQ